MAQMSLYGPIAPPIESLRSEETLTPLQQAREARSAGYRCYAQLAVYSSEVSMGEAWELGIRDANRE